MSVNRADATATRQPNVLFIICDDLNNAIAGMGRRPCAPAPNIQRLLRGGVRFVQAYNNCPICLPSRNSALSGLYPHSTGSYMLWDDWRTISAIAPTQRPPSAPAPLPLLRDAVMMPRHFKNNGYSVFGAGKVFHQGALNPERWDDFGYGPNYSPFLWDRVAKQPRPRPDRTWLYEGEPLASYARRYEDIDRAFLDGPRYRHHFEMGFGPMSDVFGGTPHEIRGLLTQPYRYRSDEDRDPLPDELTAAWGVEILKRSHDKPFFLALGFMKPHTPLNAPSRFFDQFPPDQLELPPLLKGDIADCARALIEHRPYGFLMYGMIRKGGEALWRQWLQAYLACIAFVDEQVGKVLDALEASPYRDNTVVVFTSNNGYHMGEKDYLFKDSLWEEGGQVPIVIHAPGTARTGSVCSTPVSLIDLYPTLIDLCSLPKNPNAATHGFALQGHSLRSLLADPERGEWDGPPVALTSVRGDTGIHHSVRSRVHRYTLCGNGEEELYDHASDAHEWRNRAHDPSMEEIRTDLRAEMMKLLWG